ncbi:TraR/DksA C4-type zinc finger protein [Clostridium sp.]|uniref:TraR/DksA C4-type zinc finger protein n=1 Tax=Clostridium sp. TaxID=1506 RepID=UPI002FC64DF9
MNKNKLNYFKEKLLEEKNDVNNLIKQMSDNDTTTPLVERNTELSYYDNHGAENGGELNDLLRGLALEGNEKSIRSKIDRALRDIENGDYGVCKICGKEIPQERLEFIPYAEHCVGCQNGINAAMPEDISDASRPVEEEVLGRPFRRGFNDHTDYVGFDAEDSYQAVASYNSKYYDGYDDDEFESGYVEPVELISNDQYKSQLPD